MNAKKTGAALLSLILSICCLLAPIDAQAALGDFSPVERDSGHYKFMSFNLRYDTTSHPLMSEQVRGAHLLSLIQGYDVDSVGFQEATDTWMNYLRVEMAELGYGYVGVGRDSGTDDPSRVSTGNEFSSIFYRADKYDLLEGDTFWLSTTPDQLSGKEWNASNVRICTYAVLQDKTTGQIYAHFNTHLDHISTEAQEHETRLILAKVQQVSSAYGEIPFVITGDFNTIAYDATMPDGLGQIYRMFTSETDDAREVAQTVIVDGATFSQYQNPDTWESGDHSVTDVPNTDYTHYAIDHIFLAKGMFEVSTYTVVNDTFTFDYNGTTWTEHPCSDHYGVYCEAKLTNGTETFDESRLVRAEANTYTDGNVPSEETMKALAAGTENLAAESVILSNVPCSGEPQTLVDGGLDLCVENGSYTGNSYWEITVQLPTLSRVSAVAVTPGEEAPAYLQVFGSPDGVSWMQLGDTVLNTTGETTFYQVLRAAQSYRYIRINAPYAAPETSLRQVQVFGNLVDGEIIPVSGFKSGESEGYEKLLDGSTATKFYFKDEQLDGDAFAAVVFRTQEPVTAAGYALTTGNDTAQYSDRNPTGWALYGSNDDGNTWTILSDMRQGASLPAANYKQVKFAIDEPAAYDTYKLEILPGSGSAKQTQLAEFTLLNQEEFDAKELELIPVSGLKSGEAEGYEKLLDDDVSTKFYFKGETLAGDAFATVVFRTAQPVTAVDYTVTTGDDTAQYSDRNPTGWVLYGSDDGGKTWTVLSDMRQQANLPATNSTQVKFSISEPAAYDTYKLEIMPGTGSELKTQLADFGLLEEAPAEEVIAMPLLAILPAQLSRILPPDTAAADLNLPETVQGILSDGTEPVLAVAWDLSAYQPEAAISQTITGQLRLPETVANPENLVCTATIILTNGQDVDAAGFDRLVEALPAVDELTLEDANAVAAARAVYESLSAEEQAKATQLAALEAAEARIAALRENALLLGDMNKDGSRSVTDVVLLRKAILQNDKAEDAPAGDMNGDGSLSVTDVVLLRKAILQGK